MEVVRKGTNSKRMKRMCEYYSTSWAFGTATTSPFRQKRPAVALCALLAPQSPNEPPSPQLAATAASWRGCARYPRFDRLNASIWR